ncbi:hypothetical protein ACYOEI_33570 [Singulisphaera rosea]
MKRLVRYCAIFLLMASYLGCSQDYPAPPTADDPKANMPEEVRQAEEKFEAQAKKRAEKANKKH